MPLKLIFFKLLHPRTGQMKIFEGICPNFRQFFEKFFHVWKTWVYQYHISDYSSVALVPLICWCPRQLPLKVTTMKTTVTNASNLDMLLFFVPQLQHDTESDHQQLIFQQDCINLHYHLRCKHY